MAALSAVVFALSCPGSAVDGHMLSLDSDL